MSSGFTNEASSEGLDLNSEAVPLGEEFVSVVRVTESTSVALNVSVAETLGEQVSIGQCSNAEEEATEAEVPVEGLNLLEAFDQGADVREGGMDAHVIEGSSTKEQAADVALIKEDSERETNDSLDASAGGKLGGEPDVALTLKLCASDTQVLEDRGEVTEAESSVTITELTVEEIHVASGQKTVELENSEVSNPKGDVQKLEDRGEVTEAKTSMKITQLTVEEVHDASGQKAVELENSENSNTKGDVKELEDRVEVTEAESSMTITELAVEEIHVASGEKAVELENSEVSNPMGDVLEPMDLDEKPPFSEKNHGLEVEGVERSTEPNGFRDLDPSVVCGSLSNGEHDITLSIVKSDVSPSEDGKQQLVAQVGETLPDQVITEDTGEPKPSVSCALPPIVVQVNYTQVTGSLGHLPDQSQDADVQIASVCGSNHEGQRMSLPSFHLDSSPLVENQLMEVEVVTAAAGGCHKLDENQVEFQSQPISSDPDLGSLVVDLDSHTGTDVNKKTVDQVLNEDERTKIEESGGHAIHPGTDGKQETFDEAFEKDGGTAVKEMGDNVTNPGKDGIQKTVVEVFKEEEGNGIKEMLDENKNIADDVFKEGEGTVVKEMGGDVTHLGRDGNQETADKVLWEGERTDVKEARDGVTCLGTDGNLEPDDEVFQKDEGMEIKDGNQMILDDALKEDEGIEAKEMEDDVTHLGSDGDQKNVEEVLKEDEGAGIPERDSDVNFSTSDCLDENITKNVVGVDWHVNQNIETSEEVTTTLRAGTASVNDNQAFYGLATEKEGEFSVSDLVWGKVKSHPWWPGQIFDPSDASEQAMKYRKKESFFVAYFGDRTFAWNEASLLKPFRTNFSQMEKQTNSESFRKAVNCALDEIARRVELGLACSCTSEEVYAKIGSQMIENTGIRKESSRREGVDKSLSVSSFKPEMLVEYIRALALFPYGGVDRLELVIAQAQLLALCRSRGYFCLPKFQLCGGLVENETDTSILAERKHSKETVHDTEAISENEDQVLSGKGKMKSRDGSFRKRKHTSENGVHLGIKERSLSELMAGKKVSSSDDGNESVEGVAASKPVSSASGKKCKVGDSFPDDLVTQNRKRSILLSGAANADSAQPKRSFKVGESICRVASQLTGSTPILKCSSERLRKSAAKVDQSSGRYTWVGGDVSPRTPEQRRKIVIPTEHSTPDEMLSQLCLAARDPMKGYSFLTTIISFFSEFRNSVCLDHTSSWKHKMSSEKVGGRKKRSLNSNTDFAESYAFEDMQDSYWTDRIVQIGPEEQPLDKSRKKRGRPRKKMVMLTNGDDNSHQWSPTLDIVQQNPDDIAEQPVEIPVGSVDANSKDNNSPAALILSFSESDADCIPSEKNLNRLLKHFGPLKESETEVLKTSNCARVVFKRHTDAEVALSSAGKFSIFGPMHVSYRLMYLPSISAKFPSLAATEATEYVPQYIEDMAPEGIEYMAPEAIEYMTPEGMEDMTLLHIEDVAPQGMEDMVPEGTEDIAPQDIEDMEPEGLEDMAPETIEYITPEGMEDMTPRHIEDVAPEGMEDMVPEGTEDMVPEGTEDMAPQDVEDMAPEGIEDMAPEGTEDMAPQPTEDVAPEGSEGMAPEGTKEMAPQCIEDMAPQCVEDMTPQHRENLAPQDVVDDMAAQGIEDMAPAGGNTS